VQSAEFFNPHQTLTLSQKSRLALYSGITPLSSNTLLATAPNGEKCVLKKNSLPKGQNKKAYLEHVCSFLHQYVQFFFFSVLFLIFFYRMDGVKFLGCCTAFVIQT